MLEERGRWGAVGGRSAEAGVLDEVHRPGAAHEVQASRGGGQEQQEQEHDGAGSGLEEDGGGEERDTDGGKQAAADCKPASGIHQAVEVRRRSHGAG